ncbi:MAG: PA2778 family cysteine peptidase [Gammaproteobacteria bacterium]|uniref:PA2778 family cysteine peptidase n=1 Tax=Limnobacter sp. TaxID=2003368 RepID=UPI001DB59D8E|nr:PA2778 family cysteine peptidase [Limnobacter sp.]MBU0782536.1 PA2778 family cysteine peptidase [Gammaproteobacteria bacterium]MBU0850124.1 PA2778 family cysteine peptidase [Gammaproteobacteria bacterium]MBU1268612.1 PA2778 family cysteine peptidase [Gammaproteobacteria bacterium]MBU1530036.1 PA2778 family cysteine peptidase [Gammaproteobacteria bacterium]MBU1780905.1 PA2778 family cysteine peptidase [Gammaproteobacteria bacterium]
MKLNFSSTAWTRLAGSAVLVGLLAGCSLLPTVPQDLQSTVQTQATVELKNVPFFAQEEYYCGPSTLAMVLNHQGESTKPDELAKLVYLPGRQGSLQLEMLAAPRRMGYLTYQIDPRLPALFDALNAGSPVVVLLNLSLQIAPQWHYAVVVGYDAKTNNMIMRSGPTERDLIPVATFLKLWERAQNWGFTVIKPSEDPPIYTNAQGYLNSAVALERSSKEKAALAYQQGAKTWPKEPWFHFGLGNLAYGEKNYVEAEQNYRKAVGVYPDMADAWNNLAEALIKLERKSEARAAINKAIAIGGNRVASYKETAQKIQAD